MRVIRATWLDGLLLSCRHATSLQACIRVPPRTFTTSCTEPVLAPLRHVHRRSIPKGEIRARFSSTLSYFDPALPLSPAQKDTIYALSTPPGRAGVAVIRISGPRVLDVYGHLIKPKTRRKSNGVSDGNNLSLFTAQPEPWKMHRCSIINPDTKQLLDEGLAVYFAGPRSFTSEDVLELHIHSGPAIISAVLSTLSKQSGCRMAERGEFTKRAFEAGRLDLTQVEGLRDLIDAETEAQRRWALGATQGKVREEVETLREEIIACLMLCEAEIDFGDTEEIDEGVIQQAKDRAKALLERLRMHLRDSRKGEIMRSGIKVVIFGEPNAGKSSLLNWLAQREAAIVTPLPGTTRDVLEVSLDLGGLPITVCDTAGLRNTTDLVESIGVKRASDAVREADIALWVVSIPELEERHRSPSQLSSSAAQSPDPISSSHSGPVAGTLPAEMASLVTSNTLVLMNKLDLAEESAEQHGRFLELESNSLWPDKSAESGEGEKLGPRLWRASVTTGEGMHTFAQGLVQAIKDRYDMGQGEEGISGTSGAESDAEGPLIRNARHRIHMENAVGYLEAFLRCMGEHEEEPNSVVLGAEELRYAAKEIGSISRAITVDDLLDSIFQDFCIGK